MKINFGKRAQLGGFLAMFAAAIAIAIILFFYVFYGIGLAKTVSDFKGGMVIYNESQVEIGNVFNYTNRYVNLTRVRFLVAGRESLDVALRENGYGG